jgi:Zn-finger nucleic acid-binding protein
MQYLICPVCHAGLHGGLLYEELESCPRCGAPLHTPAPSLLQRLRAKVARRRTVIQAPDWEQITRSQYAERRYVSRTRAGTNGASHDRSQSGHGEVDDVA